MIHNIIKILLLNGLLLGHINGYAATYTMSAENVVLHPNGMEITINNANPFVLPFGSNLIVDKFNIDVPLSGANKHLIELQGNNTVTVNPGRSILATTPVGQASVLVKLFNPTGQGRSKIVISTAATIAVTGRDNDAAYIVATKSDGYPSNEELTFDVSGNLIGAIDFSAMDSSNNVVNILQDGSYERAINQFASSSVQNSTLNIGGYVNELGENILSNVTLNFSTTGSEYQNRFYPIGNVRVFTGSTFDLRAQTNHSTLLPGNTFQVDSGANFNFHNISAVASVLRVSEFINQGNTTLLGVGATARSIQVQTMYNSGSLLLTAVSNVLHGIDAATAVLTNDVGGTVSIGNNAILRDFHTYNNVGETAIIGNMENVNTVNNDGVFSLSDGSVYDNITHFVNNDAGTFNFNHTTSQNNNALMFTNYGLADFQGSVIATYNYVGDEFLNHGVMRLRGNNIDGVTIKNYVAGTIVGESGSIINTTRLENYGTLQLSGLGIDNSNQTLVNHGKIVHTLDPALTVQSLIMESGSSYELLDAGKINVAAHINNYGTITVNGVATEIQGTIRNYHVIDIDNINEFSQIINNGTLTIGSVTSGYYLYNDNIATINTTKPSAITFIHNSQDATLTLSSNPLYELTTNTITNHGTIISAGNINNTVTWNNSATSTLIVQQPSIIKSDNFSAAGVIEFMIDATDNFGKLSFENVNAPNILNLSDATLSFKVAKPLVGVHEFLVMDYSAIPNPQIPSKFTEIDKFLYSQHVTVTNDEVRFYYQREPLSNFIALSSNAKEVATALEDLYINYDDVAVEEYMQAILDNVNSVAELEHTLNQVAPNTTYNIQNFSLHRILDNVLTNRMNAKLLSHDDYTIVDEFSVWLKYFKFYNKQNTYLNYNNYAYSTQGFMYGAEVKNYRDNMIGASFSNSKSHLTEYLDLSNQAIIESHKALLYYYSLSPYRLNFNWDLGISVNKVYQKKRMQVGEVAREANSNFAWQNYFAKVGISSLLDISEHSNFVSRVNLQFMRNQSYLFNETGAGKLNLNSKYPDKNMLNVNAGFYLLGKYDVLGLQLKPQIGISLTANMLDNAVKIKSYFVDNKKDFKTTTSIPRYTLEFIGALQLQLSDRLIIDIDANLEIYERYRGIMVALKGKYNF